MCVCVHVVIAIMNRYDACSMNNRGAFFVGPLSMVCVSVAIACVIENQNLI